jgi:hypothetical protein
VALDTAKLGGQVAGVVLKLLTGNKEVSSVGSGFFEWFIRRMQSESAPATLESLSKDIAQDLRAHFETTTPAFAAGDDNIEAVLDNAFEAIGDGPSVESIVKDYNQDADAVARATLPLLAARFAGRHDPVRERAEALTKLFYQRLLANRLFRELAEPAFREVVLSGVKGLREQVDAVHAGTQGIEQLLTGLPGTSTSTLRVAASNLLLDAQRVVWTPSQLSGAVPDLRLLLPKYRIVEFEHRDQELSDFGNWCNEAQLVDLRLYVGVGGTGKTRLMVEACEQQWRTAGWRAGFMRHTNGLNRIGLYRGLLEDSRSLLVVFDYAELRREEIQTFISCVLARLDAGAGDPRIRIVLLSREAGDWWEKELPAGHDGVPEFLAGVKAKQGSVQRLKPIAGEQVDRTTLFSRWRSAFAQRQGRAVPETVSLSWKRLLAQPGMDRSLFIAIAALASAAAPETQVPASIEAMLQWIINRERTRWRASIAPSP